MKYIYKILPIIIILICGCSTNTKEKLADNNSCLDGYILIVYLGEQNKPIFPLLIKTNKQDSTYLQYFGESREKLEKNGFLISDFSQGDHVRINVIDKNIYSILNNYIMDNNTHQDRNIWTADNNSIKIILNNGCDSLAYAVNKSNSGYFSNLIDSVKRFNNAQLEKNLLYYKSIQEFDVEDLYKAPY